jgi:hypothetical protein
MYSAVRPMNRSTISASVSGQPSSARYSASTRTARRSLSTSTPSQSKMTSSNGPSTPVSSRAARPGRPGRSVAVLDPGVGGVEQLEDVLDPEGVQLGREGGRAQVEPELVAAAGVQVDAAQERSWSAWPAGHADRVEGQPARPHLVAEPAGGRVEGQGHRAVGLGRVAGGHGPRCRAGRRRSSLDMAGRVAKSAKNRS